MADRIELNDGTQISTPEWAKDATLQKLVEVLTGKKTGSEEVKQLDKIKKAILNLNDKHEKGTKAEEKNADDLEKAIKDLDNSMEDIGFKFESAGEGFFGGIGKALDKGIGAAVVVAGTAMAALTAKLIQTGQNFTELSQRGLALEGQTAANIGAFNELGMSTKEAVSAMINNSQILRVMGDKAVPQLADEFLALTSNGIGLGMALDDTIGLVMDELSMRTTLLNLGNLDKQQRSSAIKQISDVNKKQLQYSMILGVSTDHMRDFANQVLKGNKMLMAKFTTLPDDISMQLSTGLTDFASAMSAMGGEAGEEIAAAVIEAASMGAIGFSEAAFAFVTVLPQLADNMQGVIDDMNAGFIDGGEAAMAFTKEIGNLSESEKQRVFLLARAGDEQAKSMAQAIKQFEQAADNLEGTGGTVSGVQKGFLAFNAILDKVKGLFSKTFNMFIQGFGEGAGELGDVLEAITNAFMPVMRSLFGMDGSVGDFYGGVEELGESLGSTLKEKIFKFAEWLHGTILYMQGYFSTFDSIGEAIWAMVSKAGTAMLDAVINAIGWKAIGITIGVAAAAAVTKGILAGTVKNMVTGGGGGGGAGGGAGMMAAGKGMKSMGRGMRTLAVGARAFASPMVIAGMAVITAAIIGIGYALKLAAPGIEAFGKAIKAVFEGIGAVVESVGVAIAKVVEAVGKNKVAKINARAEAMVKTTKATTEAIKELSHLDPANVKGLAEGVSMLGESLGTFSNNMTPGVIDSLKSGFMNLMGAQSPIQAVMELTANADPVKMMDVAKGMMAQNAANAGATKLDNSLSPSSTIINNDGTTTNVNTNNSGGGIDSKSIQGFVEMIMAQNEAHHDMVRRTNRLLTTISEKT